MKEGAIFLTRGLTRLTQRALAVLMAGALLSGSLCGQIQVKADETVSRNSVSDNNVESDIIEAEEASGETVWADASLLFVDGEPFVKGKVLKTEKTDADGDTVVFDPENMTLTFTDYDFSYNSSGRGSCMEIYALPSALTVIFNGKNTCIVDEDSYKEYTHSSIYIHSTPGAILTGNGSFESNLAIRQIGCSLLIKDCNLKVNAYAHGMDLGDDVVIDNANIDLTINNDILTSGAFLYCPLFSGRMTIKNSVIRASAELPDSWQSVRFNVDNYMHEIPMELELGSDMRVVNNKGEKLYMRKYYYRRLDNYYYVYSTLAGDKDDLVTESSQISRTVNFISAGKEERNQAVANAVSKINVIGTVTLNSGKAIEEAKNAVDALNTYGEYAAGMREQVTNLSVLATAEGEYAALVKEKEENGKKPSESGQSTQIPAYKTVTVNGKKYKIPTAKLKKVKSKKKKTATVAYKKIKNCSGYQIQYSTSSKFKKSATRTVSIKNKSKSKKTVFRKTLKKLKRKKTYYIRIRAYKTINGKKYYGYYSAKKKVKIK